MREYVNVRSTELEFNARSTSKPNKKLRIREYEIEKQMKTERKQQREVKAMEEGAAAMIWINIRDQRWGEPWHLEVGGCRYWSQRAPCRNTRRLKIKAPENRRY